MFLRRAFAKKSLLTPVFAGAGLGALLSGGVALAEDVLHPPAYPWPHKGIFETYDHAAMRRGFDVYRQVCSSCHSMNYIAYRNLVGTTHTEEQAKALAASIDVKDGPNDQGEMFDRPGKLSDFLPAPYPNDEAGRAANGGALPPDLSCIVKARHDGADYILSLLTSYRDAPSGVSLRKGLFYNPYFPGGAIAMPKPLNDGQVEFEDGTEASVAQMAKDVTTFLCWASEPEHDERKKQGGEVLFALAATCLTLGYWKRFKFSIHKTARRTYPDNVRKL